MRTVITALPSSPILLACLLVSSFRLDFCDGLDESADMGLSLWVCGSTRMKRSPLCLVTVFHQNHLSR